MSLTFSAQIIGTTSAAQSVTLTNSGSAPLTIAGIALTGTNAADFARTTTCPSAPSTLAAGATCTISVTFTPTATGGRSASISITNDATGSPHTIALSGTGATPGAIALDKSLGTKSDNVTSTTITLTTTSAAVANARVFVFVTWAHSTRTLTSIIGMFVPLPLAERPESMRWTNPRINESRQAETWRVSFCRLRRGTRRCSIASC